RVLALGLAKHDQLGPSKAAADIQAGDEVDPAVGGRPGQATRQVIARRRIDHSLGHGLRERLEAMLLALVEGVDLSEQDGFSRARSRQLLLTRLDEQLRHATADAIESCRAVRDPVLPSLRSPDKRIRGT